MLNVLMILVVILAGVIFWGINFYFKYKRIKNENEIVQNQNQNLQSENSRLNNSNQILETQNVEYKTLISAKEKEILQLKDSITNINQELHKLRENHLEIVSQNATYVEKTKNLEKLLEEQKAEFEKLQEKFRNEFELISKQILEQTTKKLAEQNEQILFNVTRPFKENITQIKELEQKIQNYYDNENKERASLKTNIENLIQQSNEVKQTAEKLANALTSKAKFQGDFGEFVLEKLLELSGLQKNIEYKTQYIENEKKPDVLILLPNDKYLIIDSKVTLNSLIEYHNAQNENERVTAAQKIITSVKKHYEELSKRQYEIIEKSTLDFVLMFIPIEHVYDIIFQYHPELFNDAVKKRVLIVTPSSLLATLKTIYYVWKQEKQRKEFENVIKHIEILYHKIKTFTTHFANVEKALQTAFEKLNEAKTSLISGKGNAMSIIEKKIKPYINPKESIHESFLPENDED